MFSGIALLTALLLAPVSGAVNPHLSRVVLCATGFRTSTYRHVTIGMKHKVCARDRATNCPGHSWEIDHDIPIEVGGSNDINNLWAQPIEQARIKDKLENRLHRMVCDGTITLPAAQKCIADNWVRCYDRIQ